MAKLLSPILAGLYAALVFWSITVPRSNAYVHNLIGTPYLYIPQTFVVDPDAPRRNAPTYQRAHGYRAAVYLDNINQRTIESNPKIYDVEDSTRRYYDVLPQPETLKRILNN